MGYSLLCSSPWDVYCYARHYGIFIIMLVTMECLLLCWSPCHVQCYAGHRVMFPASSNLWTPSGSPPPLSKDAVGEEGCWLPRAIGHIWGCDKIKKSEELFRKYFVSKIIYWYTNNILMKILWNIFSSFPDVHFWSIPKAPLAQKTNGLYVYSWLIPSWISSSCAE